MFIVLIAIEHFYKCEEFEAARELCGGVLPTTGFPSFFGRLNELNVLYTVQDHVG